MKKLSFITLLLVSNLFYAQAIDENFLKTLPEDMQADILSKAENQQISDEPVYRGIRTKTELEKQNLVNLKDRLSEDLKNLEKILEKESKSDELKLFGSDFFSTFQSSFMPINEPSVSSKYILDFGDVLEIQLVGQQNYINEFPIGRDGTINLQGIGKINVSKLSLSEAISLIKLKVSNSFIATDVFVALVNIRDINIVVSGNAYNPGIYTLNGNSNILHALNAAGGINEYGSMREINLIRGGEIIETFDLYSLLIEGDYLSENSLRTGDVIFVTASKNIVTIDGAVKRPGKYELKQSEKLSLLLRYANGLDTKADFNNIFLERVIDNSQKSLPIVNIKQFDSINANHGDLVYIRKIPYKSITIKGAVMRPGTYTMHPEDTLNKVIEKAGGLTKNAYPFGAVYETKKALEINIKAKDELYQDFLNNIIAMSQNNVENNTDIVSIVNLTSKIKNSNANGRMVVGIFDENNDLVINNDDRLTIPEIPSHVYIYGEVATEGAIRFDSDADNIEFYLNKSGGLKQFANSNSIYILHPNGESERYIKTRNIFENQPASDLKVYPGSIIYVPRKIDNSLDRRLSAQAYTSILGSLAVTIASLSSINN